MKEFFQLKLHFQFLKNNFSLEIQNFDIFFKKFLLKN